MAHRPDRLSWEQPLNRLTNLGGENLITLAIEVNVVAMEFGMSSYRRIEVDNWNLLGRHDFACQSVPSRNSLV